MANNTAKQKAQFSYNHKQVQFLCGISQQDLVNFQIETARAWLDYTLSNPITAERLMACQLFTAWWQHQWNRIDDRAILRDIYEVKTLQRYSWYRQMHQYVFDGASAHGQYLLKDFMDMQPEFTAALKAEVA